MKLTQSIMIGLASLFFLVSMPEPAAARQDQDEAQRARKQADLIPYGQIARIAVRQFGGRVVGQTLKQRGANTWVYNLRLLMEDGKVLEVIMNAKTGKIISTKGR